MKKISLLLSGIALMGLAFTSVSTATTLEDVQARGELRCGVDGGVAGFSAPNNAGRMVGIDASICDAIAAAVLGDKDAVVFVPLTAAERFTALTAGEIDVLSRNTTHTLTRDATLGVNFTYYNFIDGQGFMVAKADGLSSVKDLDGASICVQTGTTTELNMADYFRNNNLDYTPVGYSTSVGTREGLEGGACDAITSDASQLAAIRSETANPSDWTMLPEIISKEPLGPVVRQGDSVWEDIVRWSLNTMIEAEEYGVTSANADSMKTSDNPAVKRLVGAEGELGAALGLDNDWSLRIIKQVGNYGESYKRNIADTGILPDRGPNELWTKGGILYVPPAR